MGIWDVFMLRPPGKIYLGFWAIDQPMGITVKIQFMGQNCTFTHIINYKMQEARQKVIWVFHFFFNWSLRKKKAWLSDTTTQFIWSVYCRKVNLIVKIVKIATKLRLIFHVCGVVRLEWAWAEITGSSDRRTCPREPYVYLQIDQSHQRLLALK